MTWYVRNGEIIRVGNKTQGWSTALVDVADRLRPRTSMRRSTAIRDVVSVMDEDEAWKDVLLEEPNVVGVESITAGVITIRILAKTLANEQFGVQREMRERIKRGARRGRRRRPRSARSVARGRSPA